MSTRYPLYLKGLYLECDVCDFEFTVEVNSHGSWEAYCPKCKNLLEGEE